jgi:hypothetical protein
MVLVVQGVSVMTRFGIAFAVALAASALIASMTFGRGERQPAPAQISPMQMQTGQQLPQTELVDFSLVFER